MRIECPACKLSGNIDDSTVPATGLAMTCPRCKKQFTAEKPASLAGAAMLGTCPSCQYSTFTEEKFAVCPKCGLVVADYHKQQLASRQAPKSKAVSSASHGKLPEQPPAPQPRLTPEQLKKEAEDLKKYGLDKIPGVVETEAPANARLSSETPLPVLITGWGGIIVAVFLLVYGGSGIMEYLAKLKEAKAAHAALEEAPSNTVIFIQFLLFPSFSILFAPVMLVFATQFLGMKKWSIGAMKAVAWTGIGLSILMKITDMVFWFKRASADASFGYYAMGVCGDFMIMLLFMAPFLVLAEYLKSPLFEKTEHLFF